MSALTDLFTALATKIRSKVGGAQTYTPTQMVSAIDDVYQAGVDAGGTPTQTKTVTAGTSAVTVTPDTGYALSSVTVNPTPSQSKSATPTTSAQTISPDSGKLLSQVNVGAIPSDYVIPTSITPSNTSPASMSANSNYKPTLRGYAIESYDNSVTQSAMANGAYFPSGMVKMPIAGYAYSSQQPKVATGSHEGTSSFTIDVGFKPKLIYLGFANNSTANISIVSLYCEDISNSTYIFTNSVSSTQNNKSKALGNTSPFNLNSVTSTGFTATHDSTRKYAFYICIG